MASKKKRQKARAKRQKQRTPAAGPPDAHARVVADSLSQMAAMVGSFAQAEDPVAAVDEAFHSAVARLADGVQGFNPYSLLEVARLAFLPWAPAGQVAVDPAAGATRAELLGAVALAAHAGAGTQTSSSESPPQALSRFVSERARELDELLQLSHLRAVVRADPTDKMTMIALLVRGNQVWIRNTSYAEMAEATLTELFAGHDDVHDELVSGLGFGVGDAQLVLSAVHDLQQAAMNDRFHAMADSVASAMSSVTEGELAPDVRDATRAVFHAAWEPDEDAATVAIDDLAAASGVAEGRVRAILDRFRLDLAHATPTEVVEAFTSGENPWRTRPLAVSGSGRVMLPHNALTVDAIRNNLEEHLKGSAAWDAYAKHRGELLEKRTSAAVARVLPGGTFREGFEYYLPATDAELQAGDPDKYTKRVECDHLVVLDDVAVVVEDKAVAFSPGSRGGNVARMRTDLTGIVTKAAQQCGRLREAIRRDGGLRVHGEGWVDLSHVREIHTIAVSLDDLSSVTTATAELIRAGLLTRENIPWTVSLHDLELIAELVERPAQFLLYLRRRRNPDVTNLFMAPDELDLFLYFFEAGLWVEPDPDEVRSVFPFLPEPTTAERRRHREQRPGFISSRTDALDRWFYETRAEGSGGTAPKPQMVPSPLGELVDELEDRQVEGWLSIGATLLEGSTSAQHKLANDARKLLDNPSPTGKGRSLTVPLTTTVVREEGWLLVWATLPQGVDPGEEERRLREYLRAKKHQLELPRGVLFLYNEQSRGLADVFFDSHVGPLSPELAAKSAFLHPPNAMANRPPPAAWKKGAPRRRRSG